MPTARRHRLSQGEAPLGIVYGTDAKSVPAIKVVGIFPDQSHPKIQYPVALLASAKPEAHKFLDFLVSPEARPAFECSWFYDPGRIGWIV
jgi:molybdate transport system substrate-binding protein